MMFAIRLVWQKIERELGWRPQEIFVKQWNGT